MQERPIPSPCVAACELDAQQLCSGCRRHVDEIARWRLMANSERLEVLARIEQRRADERPTLLKRVADGLGGLFKRP